MQSTTSAPRQIAEIASYHAHVYYDPRVTRGQAEELRRRVAERFKVRLGRWHDRSIGPHEGVMFQIAFPREEFPRLLPWLMLNRGELVVMIHPNTRNQRADHLAHALWLGAVLPIHGEVLSEDEPLVEDETEWTTPTLEP